jgi:uncharacterized protein (UPF0332 family)
MLTNDRINEAEHNVTSYIKDGLLKKESFKNIVFQTYLRNNRESLLSARKLLNENISNLWVVVISYYSMFYIANAILYKQGYKVGSKIAHKVTSDALIVFIRTKLKKNMLEDYEIAITEALTLSDNLLQNYDLERVKRSVFQYETTEEIKLAKAKTSIERAEQFTKEIEKLLIK